MSPTARDSYEDRDERVIQRPSGWQEIRPRLVDTGEPFQVQDRFREAFRRTKAVPLWSVPFPEGRKVLKRPLSVQIYREGEFVFAANEELVLIGTGQTSEEAVADFVKHLLHFTEDYRRLPADRVTGDAVRLKALFADIFEE